MFTTVAIMIQELVLGDGWGRGGAPPPLGPWTLSPLQLPIFWADTGGYPKNENS